MFENFLGGFEVERFAIHQNKTYHVGVTVPIFGHAGGLSSCRSGAGDNALEKCVVFRGIL